MSRYRGLVTGTLLAFVVFTAGYAVGKEVGVRRALDRSPPRTPAASASGSEAIAPPRRLIARYYHATKRCATCNKIEAYAKEVLESRFSPDLSAGRIVWETANMDDVWNADAVRRYELVRSSLVLIDMDGGRERGHVVLDGTWTLVGERAHFFEYVDSEARALMEAWVAPEGEE